MKDTPLATSGSNLEGKFLRHAFSVIFASLIAGVPGVSFASSVLIDEFPISSSGIGSSNVLASGMLFTLGVGSDFSILSCPTLGLIGCGGRVWTDGEVGTEVVTAANDPQFATFGARFADPAYPWVNAVTNAVDNGAPSAFSASGFGNGTVDVDETVTRVELVISSFSFSAYTTSGGENVYTYDVGGAWRVFGETPMAPVPLPGAGLMLLACIGGLTVLRHRTRT